MASSTVDQSSPFGDKNISACTEPVEIPIQGEVPAWLHGVLYRVGKIDDSVLKGFFVFDL